jgi:hypothetical protein
MSYIGAHNSVDQIKSDRMPVANHGAGLTHSIFLDESCRGNVLQAWFLWSPIGVEAGHSPPLPTV